MSPSKISFEPNVPVTVTLRYPAGKIVSGRFGDQVMWGTEQGTMFLDLDVAQKINDLQPQQGESVCIAKRWNGKKDSRAVWDVWLSPETEKMRAAREAPAPDMQRQLESSVSAVNERRYAPRPQPVPDALARKLDQHPQPAQPSLVEEANYLVDAFAEVLERALRSHQGRVKPEEVRALFLSAYINQSKKPMGRTMGHGDLRDSFTGGSHVA